jgi:hypothetical protein
MKRKQKKMIFLELDHGTYDSSTMLIIKFGVASGISNKLSLGVGY